MRLAVLGSGSRGNALVVESHGRRLLVDVGFSCKEIGRRLEVLGLDTAQLDGVLLTHEHFGSRPRRRCAATPASAALSGDRWNARLRQARRGSPVVHQTGAFRSPHDAREPVGYAIEDAAGRRLGVVADLGARSQLAWAKLRHLDALVLETNHDLQMLRDGPYPWHLKQRIAGRHGHLSNREAADGLVDLVSERLGCVVLYHLSETNNDPALAFEAISDTLGRLRSPARVELARQDEGTGWLPVEPPATPPRLLPPEAAQRGAQLALDWQPPGPGAAAT
nr:exodeoxyribonuclease YycJ-like [Nerophis lumbriciformis]